MFLSFILENSRLSNNISPLSILCKPIKHFKKVVFPDPLSPIIKFVFPLSNLTDMSSNTKFSLNDFDKFCTSIMLKVILLL